MSFLKKLDIGFTFLVIIIAVFIILGMTYDTINSFVNPEEYRYIHYQVHWKDEGFMWYIIKNITFILGSIGLTFISIQKLKNNKRIWNVIYYSIIIVLVIIIFLLQIT